MLRCVAHAMASKYFIPPILIESIIYKALARPVGHPPNLVLAKKPKIGLPRFWLVTVYIA